MALSPRTKRLRRLHDGVKRVRVYEYATPDYGKGYVMAQNEQAAMRKLRGKVLHPGIPITHYDDISPRDWRKRKRYEV